MPKRYSARLRKLLLSALTPLFSTVIPEEVDPGVERSMGYDMERMGLKSSAASIV